MTVNNVILKEKNIKISEVLPTTPKMHVEMHRNNEMPTEVNDKIFNCIITLEVKLLDENEKELVYVKLSYLIIALLQDEKYSQDMSNKIFDHLFSMYIKSVNDLLRESNYPPLPLNIKC